MSEVAQHIVTMSTMNGRVCSRACAMRTAVLGAFAILFALAFPAQAQTPAERGQHEHDGFMFRAALGAGYASGTWDAVAIDTFGNTGELNLAGAAGFFSVDVGGSIAGSLVLHARLSDVSVVSPTVSVDGTEMGDLSKNASLTFYLFGPAATYYVMPANVYFTLALGLGEAAVDTGAGDSGASGEGFGLEVDVGKEWWVGDNWGVGAAARFSFASLPYDLADGSSTHLGGLGFGVLFSATYQ